jgi:hypothetical protein
MYYEYQTNAQHDERNLTTIDSSYRIIIIIILISSAWRARSAPFQRFGATEWNLYFRVLMETITYRMCDIVHE